MRHLLKLLFGNIKQNLGNIFICGDDIAKFSDKQKQIYLSQLGIVWQSNFLIYHKTVFENLIFFKKGEYFERN